MPPEPPTPPEEQWKDTLAIGIAILPMGVFIVLVGLKNFRNQA
jgi:hypothetical protein